jgi:predicted AAA+ superfamily ATPase
MEIARDRYLQRLVERRGNGLIKAVTGIRRCGKSYLLLKLFHRHLLESGVDEGHIVEVALDDRANKALRDPDALLAYLRPRIATDGMPTYVILDEVQMVDEFEDVLNSLLHVDGADVYVSGSNSEFLSSDIVSKFRGRSVEVRVRPLSFAEYMSAYEGPADEGWDEYVMHGGMPLALSYRRASDKEEYLRGLFQRVYLTDIVERNHVSNVAELDELVDVLASAVGSLTNPSRLQNTFRSVKGKSLDDKTISSYIRYLEDAYLVTEAQRYDIKGRAYIGSPKKYYFEDVGLRNARMGFRQVEENHLMENVIYNELLSRGYNVDVGVLDKYGKSPEGKTERRRLEVDFVATLGSARYYVQSALSVDDPAKREQETRSLLGIPDSFRKIVVVKGAMRPRRDEDGITYMGIRDFLLDDRSLDF